MKKVLIVLTTFALALSLSGCGFISRELSDSVPESGTSVKENGNKVYSVDEFCKLFDDEKNFAHNHSDELFSISGTIEESTDIFLNDIYFNSSFESKEWNTNYKVTCQFEDKETIESISVGDTVEIKGNLFSIATSGIILKDCSLISVKTPNSSSSENQEEDPEPRETSIGKSDKDINKLTPSPTKAKPVNNDKTGKLRYSGFGNKGVNLSEYALSYYNNYFESDKEIHAVINFTDKTTTRISCSGGMLFVTVLNYVEGEDYDVDLMFTGDVIKDYIVYLDNGDIEEITEPEQKIPINSSSTSSTNSTTSSTESSTTNSEYSQPLNSSPQFSSYSRQPQTSLYILNTKTKVVHVSSCRDVSKIATENYDTTTDLSVAKSNGYKSCGHCHPY